MITNAITNEIINQTNCITNIIIINIIHKTNEITPVEIVNSGWDWVAIAQIATPFILLIWAAIDQIRKKKDTARKQEQIVNEKIKEYKCKLKEYIIFITKKSKSEIGSAFISYGNNINVEWYIFFVGDNIKRYIKEALNNISTEEIFDLLIHLKIIVYTSLDYTHSDYIFTNMSNNNGKESYDSFLKHLETVVGEIDNNEYDDEIKKYIIKENLI